MPTCGSRALGVVSLLVALTAGGPPAGAYEFEIRARTIGQGAELQSLRFMTANLELTRRRFTTTLSLDMWDLAGRLADKKLHEPYRRGARIYFSSYMRIDHDFGDWTGGDILHGGRFVDAVDLIPELETTSLNLDLLWGFFAAEGLLGGRVDLHVGRLLEADALDWWSYDGASVKLATPVFVAVEAFGGLRIRDHSPLGSSVQELDGTSGARCAEYVEGPTPGSGAWRPIDRDALVEENPFESDFDYCPQREQLMPTWGFAVASHDAAPLWARVSYRRTMSPTPGLIGDADRFEYEDVGLYPNEHGQAPGWGVNEELVSATARYNLTFGRGKGQAVPYAAIRYSFLHGLVDEGHAGARLRWGDHAIEPELYYSFPTFDGDSIFNVFSTEPYVDYRVTYDLAPRGARWRGYARGWLRQLSTEDADRTEPGVTVAATDLAGGGQIGGRYRPGRALWARLDLFHEDGFGGRRTGGYGSVRWQAGRDLQLGARLSLVDFADDALTDYDGLSFGGQLGGTYIINPDGVALHLMAEESNNRFVPSQIRLFAILDLSFRPET